MKRRRRSGGAARVEVEGAREAPQQVGIQLQRRRVSVVFGSTPLPLASVVDNQQQLSVILSSLLRRAIFRQQYPPVRNLQHGARLGTHSFFLFVPERSRKPSLFSAHLYFRRIASPPLSPAPSTELTATQDGPHSVLICSLSPLHHFQNVPRPSGRRLPLPFHPSLGASLQHSKRDEDWLNSGQ